MGGFNISGQTHALPAEAEEAKNHNVFAGGPPLWGRCDNPLARQLRSSSAQILAGWTKNVKSKKCKVLPSTPDVGARPNPCLASLGQGGGGPLRGWMEGLNILWTLHFLSSQLLRSLIDCRTALEEGGRQQKRFDFCLGRHCMRLSRNVKC